MKTREVLDALASAGIMTEAEVAVWHRLRHNASAREILDGLATAGMKDADIEAWLEYRQKGSSVIIPSISPVVYKTGTNFKVIEYLDLNRKEEVWGFEILPGICLAKKCGAARNVDNTTWFNCKIFAESMFLNDKYGKQGSLPLEEVLINGWSEDLRDTIQEMDKFLCAHGIDGETRSADDIRYVGLVWCGEVYGGNRASFFNLEDGDLWNRESYIDLYVRLAVAFDC